MSKIDSEEIFQLVHSLSKAEKRYFRLFFSRQNSADSQFLQLFDGMLSQKTYDEQEILRKFPGINLKQLHNHKQHLHWQILTALQSMALRTTESNSPAQLIHQARILFSKGLFRQTQVMIDRARAMAIKHDDQLVLLDIIYLERELVQHDVGDDIDERITRLVKESRNQLVRIKNIQQFSDMVLQLERLYLKLGFIRNSSDQKKVVEFFDSNLPDYNYEKLSFMEKVYLFQAYISFYLFQQKFQQGYGYAIKLYQLFIENPFMRLIRTDFYLMSLNYLLIILHKLKDFDGFDKIYSELIRVPRIKGLRMNEHLQVMLFRYKYMHKINHYFLRGEFRAGTKIIGVVESELERFAGRMDQHDKLIFYYKVSCLYFGAGNFKKSLVWLNTIINERDIDVRGDIHVFARILSLICHFELGHEEFLEYHIRSTYRFILKKGESFRFYRYILDFLRGLSKEPIGKTELIKRFIQLKDKLVPLEKQNFEKRPFLYFDIISWLNSRIKSISVEEAVKRRLQNQKGVR